MNDSPNNPDNLINAETNDINQQVQESQETPLTDPEKPEVTKLVDRFIRAKRITYTQYQTLSKLVLADGTVDEQERCQINRLFDAIQSGTIRIVESIDPTQK